jgi:hypothetical protein
MTYLPFLLCCYLDAVDVADVGRARNRINAVMAKAVTSQQKARAKLISDQLAYVEASVQSYPAPVTAPSGEAAALLIAQQMSRELDDRIATAAKRLEIAADLEADPVQRGQYDHNSSHYWTGYNGDEFFRLVDYLVDGEDGSGRLRALLSRVGNSSASANAARVARMVLAVADGTLTSATPNGSFETGGVDAPPWELRGDIARAEGVGRDGGAGMRIWSTPGVPLESVENDVILPVPIKPGLAAARIWYRANSAEFTHGVMSIKYHWWTSSGANILQCQQPMRFLADTGEEWAWIGVLEDVPAVAFGEEVGQLRLVASLLSYAGSAEVYWDDFELFSENA